ncbi:pentapeptide repeat-containing protein [Pseudanabaena sp. UWO310]|uniref:pentapeptide repeat-containing protein n=1 Tax=Pseudanabaena sp. UWO310 TaxID=2480795 RepID=UPI00168101E1|nr:pentapeptide repeat-containing protein [Pseudanabaena sp. UWO310]
MTQPLDFSNQLLIGRSFKGQNLAGADFRKADIRLCDFRNANLEGADFSGARAEEFYSLIFISSVIFQVVILNFLALIGIYHLNIFTDAITVLFISIVFVVRGVRKDISTGLGTVVNLSLGSWIVVFAILLIFFDGGAITTFNKGLVWNGIGFCLAAVVLLWFAYTFYRKVFNQIINATGTDFIGANLSSAKFMGAILKNCNFTNSNLFQTDWTHASFKRCKFSNNLNNQKVRELCISRIGINQNLSYIDFSNLNLMGISLRGANLTGAKFYRSNLSQADLEDTQLCNVQAIGTDFTGADLTGASIENWSINSETVFKDVVCSHIFIDSAKTERNPASGLFEQGDFEKLVTQSKNTLDFLFRNGIDPQAFDFAMQQLKERHPESEISIRSLENLGDKVTNISLDIPPNLPKNSTHAQFNQDYELMLKYLDDAREKIRELEQKLYRIDVDSKLERKELENQIAVLKAQLEERLTSKELINSICDLLSYGGSKTSINVYNSQISEIMTSKSIQSGGGDVFFTGRDNLGVSGKDQQGVAGRNISGTVTNTIQQLRETNQPEAPQLSDLLEQLQKAETVKHFV